MQMSMFSLEELPANHSASQDCERDWMIRVATSCLPILPLLTSIGPNGWYGRTSPVSCPATEEGILDPCWEGWRNSGMGSPTEFLTLNTSAAPCRVRECSLSEILEPAGNQLQPYYLTPKLLRTASREVEAGRAHIHYRHRTPEAGMAEGT